MALRLEIFAQFTLARTLQSDLISHALEKSHKTKAARSLTCNRAELRLSLTLATTTLEWRSICGERDTNRTKYPEHCWILWGNGVAGQKLSDRPGM
jgi:hypothetical protein